MAISQQAAQQVAALLTQSLGLPGGQGAEIAQRLLSASNPSGNNSSRTSSNRTISRDNITTGFRNQFRPAEQPPFQSQSGIDGKDGTAGQGGRDGVAGAAGSTGLDGARGQDGVVDYEAIQRAIEKAVRDAVNGIDGSDGSGGGGLDDLRRKLQEALDRLSRLERRADNAGKCFGNDICGVLKQQANDLKKTARKVQELEDKLKKLDKRVKAIEEYMPPEECP